MLTKKALARMTNWRQVRNSSARLPSRTSGSRRHRSTRSHSEVHCARAHLNSMLARTARSASGARSALHLGRAVAPLRRLTLPPHTILTMPNLSPTPGATTADLLKWHKKEGDKVEDGDEVASVETDKAIVEDVAQDEFYLAKILVPEE